VCVLIFFPYFLAAVTYLTPGGHGLISAQSFITPDSSGLESLSTDLPLSRSIANAHTLFSILNVFIFLPFIGFFARSATSLLPGKLLDGDSEPQCKYIDIRVINTPSIALLQARNELQRMADIALSMYDDVAAQLYSYDSKRSSLTRRKEEVLDLLQREISAFLVRLSRRPFSNGNAMELPILLHIVNNLEHVGDQNEAILDCLIRKKERKVQFSAAAMDELKKLAHLVGKLLKLSVESLGKATENDLVSARVLKDDIQKQIDFMSAQHIERLTQGTCTVLAGVVYSDIGSSFVKISEYAFNIMKTERELA
jgi:phosphate:Na+ symporter